MEHRLGQRISIDVPVRIIGIPGALGIGRLRDISASGSFVQTRLALPSLSMIEIVLPHGLSVDAPTLTGYVVRSTPLGLGIEWTEFAPQAISSLTMLHQPHEPVTPEGHRTHAVR